MNSETFDHICELSKLSFDEAAKAAMMNDLTHIIALMDTVSAYDLTYDDRDDRNETGFDTLREDVPNPPFEPDLLLANTASVNDCYAIPRLIGE